LKAHHEKRRYTMTSKILAFVASVLLILAFAVPGMAAEVAQGKCLAFEAGKTVSIDEYDTKVSKENKYGTSTGKKLTFDISEALVGITPAPGDVLRIAYDRKGDQLKALRVMNVTKQDLMKR
jgi:hypothetical protein